jgi:hypothetical protein
MASSQKPDGYKYIHKSLKDSEMRIRNKEVEDRYICTGQATWFWKTRPISIVVIDCYNSNPGEHK